MIIKKSNYQKKLAAKEAQQRAEEEAKQAAQTEVVEVSVEAVPEEEDIEQAVFDIDNIDFTQREEHRTGNRRRGYRRIDDRNLISRAQEEAVQIKEAAYQEGYNLGLENAQKDLVAFKSNIGAFLSAEKKVFEAIAPDIIEISLEIAKKIIKHEVQTDPQIIIDTVIDILKNIPKNEPKITLKVNPTQAQYVKDTLPEQLTLLGVESKLSIVSDDSVSEGSCIMQTNNGVVDAGIDAQIDIIQKALRGA